MDDTEQRWMLPSEAKRLIAAAQLHPSEQVLLGWLRAGLVAARARHMSVTSSDPRSSWGGGDESRTDHAEVPTWFWRDCTKAGASFQGWEAATFRGRCYRDGRSVQAELLVVTFDPVALRELTGVTPPPAAEVAWSAATASTSAARSDRTGGAGRPTSMHIVADMMKARAANGDTALSWRDEARALADLFASNPANSEMARPTWKAIENSLRDSFKRLKAPHPKTQPEID